MSLDLKKLEKARTLASGVIQARCPACAKAGQDSAGEHLRVYPDGRYGCCVHPKDREHRKEIFALAGDSQRRSDRSFKLKIAAASQPGLPLQSITAALTNFPGTLGTGKSESKASTAENQHEFGTFGTAILNPHAYENENTIYTCKDWESGVPSVPREEKPPYFTPDGTLVIPFSSPQRYHWWNGGQSITQTKQEILERMKSHGTTV